MYAPIREKIAEREKGTQKEKDSKSQKGKKRRKSWVSHQATGGEVNKNIEKRGKIKGGS